MPSATPLPSYAALPHWRAVNAALPAHLRVPEPWPAVEDWLSALGFEVHLDRWSATAPRATVVLVHGGGGNGRMLGMYGHMCAGLGYDAVAPDMPGYGLTRVPAKAAIRYEDWRAVLSAVIEAEAARGLPVVLFGLSMGGMLAYDAAARTRLPKALIATCLMDPRLPAARRAMVRWKAAAGLIEPLLTSSPALTDRLPVPMALAGDMAAIANDPELVRAIVADPRAGGNWMPAGFLRTFLTAEPEVAPEAFDVCPVLLAHPADDRWTDVEVSRPFFDRLSSVATELVMLEDGGHAPIEALAHEQLEAAVRRFVDAAVDSKPAPTPDP